MNLKLKEKRETIGISKSEMAKRVEISTMAYYRYETENRIPNVRTAIRIAQLLNSTVEELFGVPAPNNSNHE